MFHDSILLTVNSLIHQEFNLIYFVMGRSVIISKYLNSIINISYWIIKPFLIMKKILFLYFELYKQCVNTLTFEKFQ